MNVGYINGGSIAPDIGSFESLNFTAALTPVLAPDVIEVALPTGDVTIRETWGY